MLWHVQLDDAGTEEKTDTDKNMATMFAMLRKNRRARLENVVLNRKSFAQTIENVFALSFLVKDGRAEITVNEKGWHIICKFLCKPFMCLLHFLLLLLHLFGLNEAIPFILFQHQGMVLLQAQLPLGRFLTATLSSDSTSGIGRYLSVKSLT